MFKAVVTTLAAILVIGSASFAQAEEGTDAFLDTSRTGSAYQQVLTTKPAALPQAPAAKSGNWMDYASPVVGGGM